MPPKRKTSGPKKGSPPSLLLHTIMQTEPKPDARGGSGTITEDDILSAVSPQEVVKLINTLTCTSQDQLFTKFRTKAEAQIEHDQLLIRDLTKQLDKAQQELINKQEEIELLEIKLQSAASTNTPVKQTLQQKYVSPIRRKTGQKLDENDGLSADQLSRELELIGITLDILELLTGLRIINYEEDASSFYFDITQSSTSAVEDDDDNRLTVNYRLIIRKDTAHAADISYVPTFLDDIDAGNAAAKQRTRHLTNILPEYFCDNLMFPYNTLAQFYAKMGRALNKGVERK